MKTTWNNPQRTGPDRINAELKALKLPFRQRVDAIWLLLFFTGLFVFVILGLLGVLIGHRLGIFDPPPIQSIQDARILVNVYQDIAKKPLLDGVFHEPEATLYLSQHGGKIHRYNPDTHLWSTETPFRTGPRLLNPDILLLRSGSGNDPLANRSPKCWDTLSLWGFSAGGGLIRRTNEGWEIVKGDTFFIGSRGLPVTQGQLTAAALSMPQQWLLVGTEKDGFGMYDLKNKYWLRLSPTLFNHLPAPKITHAAWSLNHFWLGGPNGLVCLDMTQKQPRLDGVPHITGTIKDMDVDPQGNVWVIEQINCHTGGSQCLRLTRFDTPAATARVLVDQINSFPNLTLEDLHFARYWKEEHRLLVAGNAGLYSYDTHLHNWICHFRGTILDVLPFPNHEKGFYFSFTGGLGIVSAQAPPWHRADQKCQTWLLPGMNFNERLIALHYSQTGRKNNPTNTVLALGLSGKLFALDPAKTKDNLTTVSSGTRTTIDPAKFQSVAAFGNIVLLVGDKQAMVHDIGSRTYKDIPASTLPEWLSSPYLQMVSSGDQVYAAAHKEGETHMYRLPTVDAATGNFKAATLLAIVPGPVGRIRDWNGQGIGVIAGPGDGRLFRFASGREELTGPGLDDMNGVPLLDAAPYLNGIILATPSGLRDYDYQSRGWGRLHRFTQNASPKEVTACNDRLFMSTTDGRLLEMDLTGTFQNRIGSASSFDMSDSELSDVRLDNQKLFLAGKGFINRYDIDVRGVSDRWQIPGNPEITLLGTVADQPLSLSGGTAYIGNQPLDPGTGRVLNVSIDNDYIWTVRQKNVPGAPAVKFLKRYPILNHMATFSRSYFYNPYSGSGTRRITDVVSLPDDMLAVATEGGLRFYSPMARSWFQRVSGDPIPRGGRLYTLGRHLVLADPAATQLTVVNLDSQPWPNSGSEDPVIIQPKPRAIKAYVVEPTLQQLAYIAPNGSVNQWHGPVELEILPSPGTEPVPNTLKRVFQHTAGKSNTLTFSTDSGVLRYNLDRHYWSPIPLNLPPQAIIADSNCEVSGVQQWITVKTQPGGFYLGVTDLLATNPATVVMNPVFVPGQKFNNRGADIVDVQQRDNERWTFLLKDRLKYYQAQKRQWLPDVMFPGLVDSPQFYQWGDRAVVVSDNGRVWLIGRQKGLYPTSLARYALKSGEQTVLDVDGVIWRLTAEGRLYRLPLPDAGDYRDPAAPYPMTFTALEIDSNGRLLARRQGGSDPLTTLATARFDRLPPALDAGWLKWNRTDKTFAVQTPKGVVTMGRDSFVRDGRLLFEAMNALLVKNNNQLYAATPEGIWTYTTPDLRLNDPGVTFRPMTWTVPSQAVHGCFIAPDTLYRIEADGRPVPQTTAVHAVTFGDVTLREDIRRGEISGRLKNGATVFAPRGFTWDHNKRGLAYTQASGLLILSDAGLHPVNGYTGFESLPGASTLEFQRLYSPQTGIIYYQQGTSWWKRTAPGQWQAGITDPIANRVLLDNATWKWQLQNGDVRIQLKGDSFRFRPVWTVAGLGFTSDLLRDAVAFNTRLAVLSDAFTEITAPSDSGQLAQLKAPRFPLPQTDVTGLSAVTDEQGIENLITLAGSQYSTWNEVSGHFESLNRNSTLHSSGQRLAIPVANPRLRFTRSRSAAGLTRITKEFRVDHFDGTSHWVPFTFNKQRFPFDIVTSIATQGEELYIGTAAGLQVYNGTLDTHLGALGHCYALKTTTPMVPVETVGIPADRRNVIVVTAAGTSWEKASGGTFQQSVTPSSLTRRWRFGNSNSFWQFFNTSGKLEAHYKDETGKFTTAPITISNGRFPHDNLRDIVIYGGQVFTLWVNGWISRFADGSTVLKDSGQVFNTNTAAYEPQRFIPVPHDILFATAVARAGLYLQGRGNRLWRYTGAPDHRWQEQTNGDILNGLVQQSDQPYIVNRKNLRLLAPYKGQIPKGQPQFVFQYRTVAGEWRDIPWEGDRVALDNWSQFIEADRRLWAATPIGLVQFSRAAAVSGAARPVVLDPDSFIVLPIPASTTPKSTVITDMEANNERITFRCDSKSDSVYSGIPDRQKGTAHFALLPIDPFARRVEVSLQASGFWEWVLEDRKNYNPGHLVGKLRGETIELVGGRFSFDTINSLAFYRDTRVEIATDSGGWYYGTGGSINVSDMSRPGVPGINIAQVKEVRRGISPEGEMILGLRMGSREYIRISKEGMGGKTLEFSQYLGSDGFWRYQQDGSSGNVVITASRSTGSNGPVERQLDTGRFTDDMVLGLPITASDKEGNYYMVPTQAGILRMDAQLRVSDIYVNIASSAQGNPKPGILYVDAAKKPALPFYLAADGFKPIGTTVPGAVSMGKSFFPNVPANGKLLAVEDGPQDFLRVVWEQGTQRGWTLVKPLSGAAIEEFNCLYVNLSLFDKYISHRDEFGTKPPWMRVKVNRGDVEFLLYGATEPNRLRLPKDTEVLAAMVKEKKLLVIGKNHLWEIDLEQAMMKGKRLGNHPLLNFFYSKRPFQTVCFLVFLQKLCSQVHW